MPKREEIEGDWRKLRNEELYDLYSSGIVEIIKIMRDGRGMMALMETREMQS